MNAYHIVYSVRKDQCCPPSSYREVNERIVLAENEALAVAQLTGNDIEIKNIELAD
jgi:hypothetical protein